MSEDQASTDIKPQSPLLDEEFIKREWEERQTDWLIQWLVGFANSTSLEIGLTIFGGRMSSYPVR